MPEGFDEPECLRNGWLQCTVVDNGAEPEDITFM